MANKKAIALGVRKHVTTMATKIMPVTALTMKFFIYKSIFGAKILILFGTEKYI
jgi:hypothetical protein